MDLLPSALQITAIGMGLVFIALLLLWGLMELMMRLTSRSAQAEAVSENAAGEVEAAVIPVEARPAAASDLRARAAAAAVAAALAAKARAVGAFSAGPVESNTGAWQAVLRGTQLNRRSLMYSRKQRSNVR
jgi:sodium pump decarboxylase gamma subunit